MPLPSITLLGPPPSRLPHLFGRPNPEALLKRLGIGPPYTRDDIIEYRATNWEELLTFTMSVTNGTTEGRASRIFYEPVQIIAAGWGFNGGPSGVVNASFFVDQTLPPTTATTTTSLDAVNVANNETIAGNLFNSHTNADQLRSGKIIAEVPFRIVFVLTNGTGAAVVGFGNVSLRHLTYRGTKGPQLITDRDDPPEYP